MASITQATAKNALLQAMTAADFALLQPHLREIPLPARMPLATAGEAIAYAWFIESGVISISAETPDGCPIEVGIAGREGLVDVAMVGGADSSPFDCFVQIPGEALRLPAGELCQAIEASPTLRRLLAAYVQTLLIQISHTALANGANTIGQRLARWLLMSSDRLGGDTVPITHNFLSGALGVRRAGVTVAVQTLDARGMIHASRGLIAIRDRAALKAYSRDLYGPPEAEYRRLIGRNPFA